MPAAFSIPGADQDMGVDQVIDHIRSDRRIDGILLFGSHARGDADACSDIDLLVLHKETIPDGLIEGLSPRTSIAFYSPDRFSELPDRTPLFASHLAREGIVLHDRSGFLSATLDRAGPITTASAEKLARLTERRLADVLDDPSFSPDDPLSAAELYALSKQSALLASARAGVYEFNRHRALDWLGEAYPALRPSIRDISPLEAAWLARRHTPDRRAAPQISSHLVSSASRIVQVNGTDDAS